MKLDVQPGKYVIAVSGGIDSVVLLHALHALPGVQLVVAHFDHGIRTDSASDAAFVATLTTSYGLPFESAQGGLGKNASEAVARTARYDFLRRVMAKHAAQVLITAHHQDDVLETIILNLLRGTGRRGLSSLTSSDTLVRPLLGISKEGIFAYAQMHNLEWREDSTNSNDAYLRNYVRHHIVPRLGAQGRSQFLRLGKDTKKLNQAIDDELKTYVASITVANTIDRCAFTGLPHIVAREVMAQWLRSSGVTELSHQLLERLVVTAKTAQTNTRVDVNKKYWLKVGSKDLALVARER